jgi:hypothetical protein
MPDDFIHHFGYARTSRASGSSYDVHGDELRFIIVEKTGKKIETHNNYEDEGVKIIKSLSRDGNSQTSFTEVFIKNIEVFPLAVNYYDHWNNNVIKYRLVYDDGEVKEVDKEVF